MVGDRMSSRALLIIDVQNDLCPGGSMAIEGGENILRTLNRYIQRLKVHFFASRDWHPAKTNHFTPYGGEYPPHCVRDTFGAMFPTNLKLPASTIVISKGMGPREEGVSAFNGYDNKGRSFDVILDDMGIGSLYVCGLGTELGVKETVIDALERGYVVKLLTDAIGGVDAGGARLAMEEMEALGADMINLRDLG